MQVQMRKTPNKLQPTAAEVEAFEFDEDPWAYGCGNDS